MQYIMTNQSLLFLASLLTMQGSSCDAQQYSASVVPGNLRLSVDAEYVCVFTNLWSGARHPIQYPSNAHWSPPVIANHNEDYQMWAEDEFASSGMESLSETGSTSRLERELERSDDVEGFVIGSVTFNRQVQEQILDTIRLSSEYPLMSSATMIAPSPDWFSGFHDFDARSINTDSWYRRFVIETYPWDAGTETGNRYSLSNPAEDPHVPMTQITADSAPSTGVFLSPDGDRVLAVGRWTCELENEVDEKPPTTVPSMATASPTTMPPSSLPTIVSQTTMPTTAVSATELLATLPPTITKVNPNSASNLTISPTSPVPPQNEVCETRLSRCRSDNDCCSNRCVIFSTNLRVGGGTSIFGICL